MIKTIAIRMYRQSVFCTCYSHIVSTHQVSIFQIIVRYEHIYIVELFAFGFMNGRYHDICT